MKTLHPMLELMRRREVGTFGAALSVCDPAGLLTRRLAYPFRPGDSCDDAARLAADWVQVGSDLRRALDRYALELHDISESRPSDPVWQRSPGTGRPSPHR